jgi:hypothetical protein
MQDYALRYGAFVGLLAITPIIVAMALGGEGAGTGSEWLGYAIMLVAPGSAGLLPNPRLMPA